MHSSNELRLAIAGLGAIGLAVARRVDAGERAGPGARGGCRARSGQGAARARRLPCPARARSTWRRSPRAPTSIVECLPPKHFAEIARAAMARGRIFMPLSVGALIDHMDLVELARQTGARIVVPTGALLGLDAVRAAAEGKIASATIVTRKPPAGLAGAPLLVARGLSVEGLKAPLQVFAGSAREAIAGFPANVNVAVALSLAGIGPGPGRRWRCGPTPTVTRNTHTVIVKSNSSDLTMTIENIPSEENPRTGRITALSVLAALRRLTSPLVVGS